MAAPIFLLISPVLWVPVGLAVLVVFWMTVLLLMSVFSIDFLPAVIPPVLLLLLLLLLLLVKLLAVVVGVVEEEVLLMTVQRHLRP